tara:strand:- start:2046 stop:2528 length:483 start_codon:yes stop_codon:yes gene_type:complete
MSVQSTGARLKGTFTPAKAGGTLIEFAITGFNMTVEDRASIDMTQGSDTINVIVPGKRGTTSVTVNARFDQSENTQITDDLLQCGFGELTIGSSRVPTGATTDCDHVAVVGTGTDDTFADLIGFHAYLMGFSVEGSVDSAIDITLNFQLRSTGTAIGQPS